MSFLHLLHMLLAVLLGGIGTIILAILCMATWAKNLSPASQTFFVVLPLLVFYAVGMNFYSEVTEERLRQAESAEFKASEAKFEAYMAEYDKKRAEEALREAEREAAKTPEQKLEDARERKKREEAHNSERWRRFENGETDWQGNTLRPPQTLDDYLYGR